MSGLVPVRRTTKDIGLFGKKGVGKTTILTLLALIENYCFGTEIYSNYNLRIPYIKINNLEDFDRITTDKNRKVFLGDDFEYWFNSRSSHSKKNIQLNDVLLFWGKKNCSLVYTSKRELAIDKSIRESTMEFWELELKPIFRHPNKYCNRVLWNYLNFLYIYVTRFDHNLNELKPFKIYNLHKIVPYFDTSEIIEDIS